MADEIIQDKREAANYLLRQYRENPQFEFTQDEAKIVHESYEGKVQFVDSKPIFADELTSAEFIRSQDESDPNFIASEDEFLLLKRTEPTFSKKFETGYEGGKQYFKDAFGKAGQDIAEYYNKPIEFGDEIKPLATAAEALARGTMDLGTTVAGASKFIEKAPYMAAGALGLQADYKSYLNQKTIDQNYQMQAVDKINAERAQGKSIIGLPKESIMPGVAEVGSMFMDPTTFAPFVGAGAKATSAASKASRGLRVGTKVAEGVETGARAVGNVIDLGVEKIGQGIQRVLPGVTAPKTAGAIATGAAAVGIPGAFPVGAKIAATRAGAEVIEKGAQAARIMGEEAMTGPSRMNLMQRIAKNQKNPEWLRRAANTSVLSSPITAKTAELGLDIGVGSAKGAVVGAGLGYVGSGGEEEGIGGGVAIGSRMGAVGGGIRGITQQPARKALAKQGDVNRLLAKQAELGLDVESIANYIRKDNRPFLDAATLQMMDPNVQVEFHNRDSFMKPENAGINAAGVVKGVQDRSGKFRLLINMDDKRSTGDTVRHEILHAIQKSPAINKSEGRMAVMSEYGEEGLRRFGNEYARKLLEGERQGRGTPTEAEIRAKANELREGSQRSEPGAGDLDWIADEVLAEQFVGEFRGKDLDSLRRKTLPGTDLLSLQEGFLAPVGRLLNKFGIDTTGPKPTNIDTLFKDNPLVPSKQLRELTSRWFRDRDKYLDGLEKAEKQKDVTLVPGPGNRNLANNPAVKFTRNRKTNLEENDFAIKFPDGTVRAKDPASILAVDKARVADVGRLYNPDAVLERGSPEFGVKIQSDGKPYVGGNTLPEGFFNLDSFNDFTKEVAKTLQDSRQEGKTYSVWYQKIGTGEDGSWAQSVKRGLGNIKVGQSEIAFLGWRLSKAGNILAQAVDISALRGRMLDFARSGKGRINEVWGGDLASYEKDVMQYLDNHANERPGETGIGIDKRNAINYLFGITNIANKNANPMYAAEGRPPGSLVKSYRLDRIANSRDTGRTGFFFDYQKQAANLAPGEPIRSAKSDGEYMAAVKSGDLETAQKMVDEVATSSGYNLTNQWHQSKESATTFDPRYRTELSSMGFHFGTKEQAEFRSTQYDYRGGLKPSLRRFSLQIKNPYEVTHMGSFAPDHLADKMITDGILSESAYERLPGFTEQEIGSKLVKILKKNGYDGLVYKNEREGAGLSYVAFDPSQIKSADPVTYDARGNVIPLSMRFNPESKDIRFSPATPPARAPLTDEEFTATLRKAAGDPEKNLKLRLARREGTGVAKNKLTEFTTRDGKPIVIGSSAEDGGKPFSAWQRETNAWLTSDEIGKFRQWYDNLPQEFRGKFDEDPGRYMVAWLAGQQNASPGQALGIMFRAMDRIDGIISVNEKTGKLLKGGLADDKVEAILRGKTPEGGYGPKLTDFADAGLGRSSRSFMGDNPQGGQPFVADVHTGRDSGHVDQQTLTRLISLSEDNNLFMNGKPVSLKASEFKVVSANGKTTKVPEKVVIQQPGEKSSTIFADMRGSPGANQYEGISVWGNKLTDFLNEQNWEGGNWKPAQAQAVGWMRILRQYGLNEGTSEGSFRTNTRDIYAEVNYSSGAVLPKMFPEFGKLTPDQQASITSSVIEKTVNDLVGIIGGSLRKVSITSGKGYFGGEASPAMMIRAMGSKEVADMLTVGLAYVSEQTMAMSVINGQGGKASNGIYIRKSDKTPFTQENLNALAKMDQIKGMNAFPVDGYDTIFIADAGKDFKPKGFTEEKAISLRDAMSKWVQEQGLGEVDIEPTPCKIESYGQNYREQPSGNSFLRVFDARGGGPKIRKLIQYRGEYVKNLRKAFAEFAPEQPIRKEDPEVRSKITEAQKEILLEVELNRRRIEKIKEGEKSGLIKKQLEAEKQPSVGININDSSQDFTGQILAGEKTIETRDSDSLRPYVGKRVGIIRTGVGKAELVGYATIGEPVIYKNQAQFKADQGKHLVASGSEFDIKRGGVKYGYPISDVEKTGPTPVKSQGIVARQLEAKK